MNCPQCQTVNGPDAAFCGNCGTRLAAAAAPTGAGAYSPPSGAPFDYNPGGTPTAYGAPGGYSAASDYGTPGYQGPPPGYGPAGGQAPNGYMQNPYQQGQYQQGQYQQGQYQQGQYQPGGSFQQRMPSAGFPPVNFNLTRLTTVDKIIAGATFVTMISLWLPWFDETYLGQSIGSVTGTSDHGWLWLEFLLALGLIGYLAARAAWDQLPFSLPLAHERLLMVATGVQFLLILIGFFAMPSTGSSEISFGWDFGSFLALIGSIVAVGPVVYPAAKAYLDSHKAADPQSY